jgi:DNA replication and repair protein RecF
VLFSPIDLEIVIGSPYMRRAFLDAVLEPVDKMYRLALATYGKALRQRNALLEQGRREGRYGGEHFVYWDEILIEQGQLITRRREEVIHAFNEEEKNIFDFTIIYDKSTISKERFLQYQDAEMGSGVTLVGPHRDDFSIHMGQDHNIKIFGSRGQQRLVVLELKLLQLSYIQEHLGEQPVLLLDDIFSELDSDHIGHVLDFIRKQQTIVTTTNGEIIPKKALEAMSVIKLPQ